MYIVVFLFMLRMKICFTGINVVLCISLEAILTEKNESNVLFTIALQTCQTLITLTESFHQKTGG